MNHLILTVVSCDVGAPPDTEWWWRNRLPRPCRLEPSRKEGVMSREGVDGGVDDLLVAARVAHQPRVGAEPGNIQFWTLE